MLGFLGETLERERERERGENMYFYAIGHIYNLQILLSELVSLSKIQLFALSATSRTKRITSLGWNCPKLPKM